EPARRRGPDRGRARLDGARPGSPAARDGAGSDGGPGPERDASGRRGCATGQPGALAGNGGTGRIGGAAGGGTAGDRRGDGGTGPARAPGTRGGGRGAD